MRPTFSTHQRIDGGWVTNAYPSKAEQIRKFGVITPISKTHTLVNGVWEPKTQPHQPHQPHQSSHQPHQGGNVDAQGRTLSYQDNGLRVYFRREVALRAIQVEAGRCLLSGKSKAALAAIKKGRLGSKGDNLYDLSRLAQFYREEAKK